MKNQTKNQPQEDVENVLKRFAQQEVAFQNHPVWRQFGAKPREFFEINHQHVERQIQAGVMSRQEWNQKLAAEKAKIEVFVREQKAQYKKTNLKAMTGLRG